MDLLALFGITWSLMKCHSSAVPSVDKFPEMVDGRIPGQMIFEGGNIVINEGRKAIILKIVNTGDRPVQVLIFNFTCIFYLLVVLSFPFWSKVDAATYIFIYSVRNCCQYSVS